MILPESEAPEIVRAKIIAEIQASLILVPAMTYLRGGEREDEQPITEISVSDFYMSKYLITKAQFCAFLNSLELINDLGGIYLFLNDINKMSKIVFDGAKYAPVSGFEDHPVICVNWIGAMTFALWSESRLPTEAEWEAASRGKLDRSVYPWGNQPPTKELANFGENIGYTTRVGSYPPNSLGLADMAGNVWEWCKDWYNLDYYARSVKKDPQGPKDGVDKVIRGGSWAYTREDLKCAARRKRWPRIGGTNLGFRVVCDIEKCGDVREVEKLKQHLSRSEYRKLKRELERFKSG